MSILFADQDANGENTSDYLDVKCAKNDSTRRLYWRAHVGEAVVNSFAGDLDGDVTGDITGNLKIQMEQFWFNRNMAICMVWVTFIICIFRKL